MPEGINALCRVSSFPGSTSEEHYDDDSVSVYLMSAFCVDDGGCYIEASNQSSTDCLAFVSRWKLIGIWLMCTTITAIFSRGCCRGPGVVWPLGPVRYWEQPLADPGGPGGRAPPCPQDFFKIMHFAGNFKGKPLFKPLLGLRAVSGVKTPLDSPWPKILDLPLTAFQNLTQSVGIHVTEVYSGDEGPQ